MIAVEAPSRDVPEVEQWTRAEISLTSSRRYDDPEAENRVWAEFQGPGGLVLRITGFWDGGDSWKIRFAPTVMGTWTYTVHASDTSNTGLNEVSGQLSAVPYTGDRDIYQHGFIRVSDNGRAFAYDDGTPFFWLGDTHWQAPNYERLAETNHPETGSNSQFRFSAETVAAQGFTVYQTYPDAALNDGGGNVSQVDWWLSRYDQIDPLAFAEQFDVMMEHLADLGLVIALGTGVHWVNGQIGAEPLTRFAQHMVARYASYPVVWITAQEVDVENGLDTLSVWREVAATIATNDGYHHPLSAHMDSVREPMTFGEEVWHDWFATQGGHERLRSQKHYEMWWRREPPKPYLETEANYERIFGIDVGMTRRSAWIALLSGSYGYTYGGAGVWAMKWDLDLPGWDEYQDGLTWFEGLQLPGRSQMRILREFYEAIPDWQRLTPHFDTTSVAEFAHPSSSAVASDRDGAYVAYFWGPDVATGSLLGLDGSSRHQAVWFDPRTGDRSHRIELRRDSEGRWNIPQKPDSDDWVLLVQPVS